MSFDPVVKEHQDWLGLLQPVGLVVSPTALKNAQARLARQATREQEVLIRHTRQVIDEKGKRVRKLNRFADFAQEFWGWESADLAAPPDTLSTALQEYGEILRPDFAVPGVRGEGEWQILIQELPPSFTMDQGGQTADERGWQASPQARFERLLRDTGVPIGLLVNADAIRLVYAPRGETSGHLTFPIDGLCGSDRSMVAALHLLLDQQRLFSLPKNLRLPAILQASRKYQNEVSIQLAGQVLRALNELCRGFNEANRATGGELLRPHLQEKPEDVYGGLLTTLMRMVFLLYAEDRDLMPSSEVYQRCYSLIGLHDKLREDAAAYPDTMDQRFGAWAQFLTLSQLVHDGGGHADFHLPARRGRLFDPDTYPFLEGRAPEDKRGRGEKLVPPKVSDGVVFRVLDDLLYLETDGNSERISYRALDVEQIGSVYEAMMGFEVQQAAGPSIGFKPDHVVVNLATLLAQAPGDRKKWLKEHGDWEPAEKAAQALRAADSVDGILTALNTRISPLYTDRHRGTLAIAPGDIYLQPTEERRRSGSHYTPRSLTEPIVRTTLDPVLQQLGENPTPEQILNLKVCDPAMGSGAFLVEACRYLGDALVKAWAAHRSTPDIPTDQDPLLHARRIVAQRCLYGVDKNQFAVDLAKLSLWLATFAKDHPFTFVDHTLRCGDSLIGLTAKQIEAFHWQPKGEGALIRDLPSRVQHILGTRAQILKAAGETPYEVLAQRLAVAEEQTIELRLAGDLTVAAFFAADKLKGREIHRKELAEKFRKAQERVTDLDLDSELQQAVCALREEPMGVTPFHWQLEFPEVFAGHDHRLVAGGFDSLVGNPPFLGGASIWPTFGAAYRDFLRMIHDGSDGKAVDLVAHFIRRTFDLVRLGGTIGLIATNTVAQGDTRLAGLHYVCKNGGRLYCAVKRFVWPGDAAVIVSVIHFSKGSCLPCVLNYKPVTGLNSFLLGSVVEADPKRLQQNRGKAFRGHVIYGMGFTFDQSDDSGVSSSLSVMNDLISVDASNAERIFPFIGGAELNTSPTQLNHRFVINFANLSQSEAERWPLLMSIVRERVLPEREKLGGYSVAAQRNERWWQFGTYAAALQEAIAGLPRCLSLSLVSTHHAVAFQPTSRIFSHSLAIFPFSTYAVFAAIQCQVHESWARFLGSSMKDDLRYTTSDCFDTFPFPVGYDSVESMERAGRDYYEYRASLMIRNNEGLTKTYNRFHDFGEHSPEIVTLRELHSVMDRVVLNAYGWNDLARSATSTFLLDYEVEDESNTHSRKKPWRHRWPEEFRDEVLARLLELNRQRAEEERQATTPAPVKTSKPRKKKDQATQEMFPEESST